MDPELCHAICFKLVTFSLRNNLYINYSISVSKFSRFYVIMLPFVFDRSFIYKAGTFF